MDWLKQLGVGSTTYDVARIRRQAGSGGESWRGMPKIVAIHQARN